MSVALLLLLSVPVLVGSDVSGGPAITPAFGDDLIVDRDMVLNGVDMVVSGNITLTGNATLTILNSTLMFNSTSPNGIFSDTGTTIRILNSSLAATGVFPMIVVSSGMLVVNGSNFSGLAPVTGFENGGLLIDGGNAEIRNSSIAGSIDGISVVNGGRATMSSLTFSDVMFPITGIAARLDMEDVHMEVVSTGIDLRDSMASVRNSTISFALLGLMGTNSTISISNLGIGNSNEGIMLQDGCGSIIDSCVLSILGQNAAEFLDSRVSFMNSSILSAPDGILVHGGHLDARGCIFRDIRRTTSGSGCSSGVSWGAAIALLGMPRDDIHLFTNDLIENCTLGIISSNSSAIISGNRILNSRVGSHDMGSCGSPPSDNGSSSSGDAPVVSTNGTLDLQRLQPYLQLPSGVAVMVLGGSGTLMENNTLADSDVAGAFFSHSVPLSRNNSIRGSPVGIITLECDADTTADLFQSAHELVRFDKIRMRFLDKYDTDVYDSRVTVSDTGGSMLPLEWTISSSVDTIYLPEYVTDRGNVSGSSKAAVLSYNIAVEREDGSRHSEGLTVDGSVDMDILTGFLLGDLIVRSIAVSDDAQGHGDLLVTVNILNCGDTFTGDFSVRLAAHAAFESSWYIVKDIIIVGGLDSDEDTDVVLHWSPGGSGDYVLEVVVDPDNEVREINETNDRISISHTVGENRASSQDASHVMAVVVLLICLIAMALVYLALRKV